MKKGWEYFKTEMSLAASWYMLIVAWGFIIWRLALDTFWDPLTALALAADVIFLIMAWKQILWNPVMGDSTVLHESLPVTSLTSSIGKVFAAGIGLGLMISTVLLAFYMAELEMSNDLYRNAEWINWINTRIKDWKFTYGLSPAGIGRVAAFTWIPSFAAAGLAQAAISTVRKGRA